MSANPGKRSIMNERKIQPVSVTVESKAHRIYLTVEAYPNLSLEEYRTMLVGKNSIGPADVYTALRNLTMSGYLTSKTVGKGKNKWTTWAIDSKYPYTPRKISRKVAPNDTKALKSIIRKTAREEAEDLFSNVPTLTDIPVMKKIIPKDPEVQEIPEPTKPVVRPVFKVIQGMALIDANDPTMSDHVKEIAAKLGISLVPPLPELVRVPKYLTAVFLDFGNKNDAMITGQQFAELYADMRLMFM